MLGVVENLSWGMGGRLTPTLWEQDSQDPSRPVPEGKGRLSPVSGKRQTNAPLGPLPRTLRVPIRMEKLSHRRAFATGSIRMGAPSGCCPAGSSEPGRAPGVHGAEEETKCPGSRDRAATCSSGWGQACRLRGSRRGQLTFLGLADDLRGLGAHAGRQVLQLQIPGKEESRLSPQAPPSLHAGSPMPCAHP